MAEQKPHVVAHCGPTPVTMKRCSRCDRFKPLDRFNRSRIHRDGRKGYCKLCAAHWNGVQQRRPQSETERKERLKSAQFKYKYGITLERYNETRAEQDYRCAICLRHEDELSKSLAIDHCHSGTGVRGLLCMNCNTGLGHFRDDWAIVGAALEYLAKHEFAQPIEVLTMQDVLNAAKERNTNDGS